MRTARATEAIVVPVIGIKHLLRRLARGAFVGAVTPPVMTVEQTQASMEAYAKAFLDGEAYEAFFADDIVVSMVGISQEIKGLAAARDVIDVLHQEQFNAAPKVTNFVVGPGQAALELDFVGIASTGKRIDVPLIVVCELKDEKITTMRIYGLLDGLVHQLTAVQKMRRVNVGPTMALGEINSPASPTCWHVSGCWSPRQRAPYSSLWVSNTSQEQVLAQVEVSGAATC
jgi:hypothetical protein